MKPVARLSALVRPRIRAARHKALTRVFSGVLPYYVVNEFPKSGGTWLAEMLSEALDVPFRRNQPLRLERSIVHGHFLSPYGLRNVVVVWRDPRDVIVSLYHHCYFINEHQNFGVVAKMKDRLPFADYEDVRANLPAFIRFIHTTPLVPRFTLEQFAAGWLDRSGVVHTSYALLRGDTVGELGRIVSGLTGKRPAENRLAEIAARHEFSKVKAAAEKDRRSGTERSFVRAGSVGGWVGYFSDEALEALPASYAVLAEKIAALPDSGRGQDR